MHAEAKSDSHDARHFAGAFTSPKVGAHGEDREQDLSFNLCMDLDDWEEPPLRGAEPLCNSAAPYKPQEVSDHHFYGRLGIAKLIDVKGVDHN